ARNFAALRDLIARCHEVDATKRRLVKQAAVLVRSLYRAGIIVLSGEGPRRVVVAEDLQWDFSLHQALSLFALSALEELDPASPTYAVDVLSVVESILEDPDVVLRRQADREKGRLVAQLKEEGVPYEERMERLAEVTHPRPLADFLYGAFNAFRAAHPWTAGSDVSPKSIGREMFETFSGFSDYVKSYGLERSEGVLLRYLSQLYRTLDQTVPEAAKTEEVWDVLGFFRSLVGETDASLLEEWERLRHPELRLAERTAPAAPARWVEATWLAELLASPRVFAARVRAEAQLLVRALARRDWEEAAERVFPDTGDPWDAARFETALAPFFEEYGELLSGAEARRHHLTRLTEAGPRRWQVTHTLLDPNEDNAWAIFADVDLTEPGAPDGPILRIRRIGS
ncbi:MAG TPA: DUF3516 domain-containing protein, partial [Thermoanaerobaculia bacterium]|nr:DUF3516 domain-containing protein [Thermoanaerobaculia bacterium]